MKNSRGGLLMLALLLLACVSACSGDRNLLGSIQEMPGPASGESGQPNLSVGPKGDVYLSWLELSDGGVKSLRFSAMTGEGWAKPQTVVSDPNLLINWADFPSLLELPNGTLAAHWLATLTNRGGYNVTVATSRDKGVTWSPPATPHRDEAWVEHGFVSLVPAGDGVAVLWLDSRNLEKGSEDVALMSTNVSVDGKPGDESVVDERVCECCQPASVAVPGGFLTVYRDRSPEEIRDIVITRFDGKAWSAPKTIFDDRWQIQACPIQGPAISAAGDHVAVAWFTGVNNKSKVQVALSADGGKTFGAPVQVDEGEPIGRVDVAALESGGAVVTWIEHSMRGGEVRARQVSAGGSTREPVTVAAVSIGNSSGFPRVERSGDSIVFAWTDTDEHRVRTAVAR